MISRRSKRFTQIGLDRLVRLKWLDQTASLVLAGNNYTSIKTILQADMKDVFRSGNSQVRGSIDKSITVLLKVWLTVPSELESLRISGLELIKHFTRKYHLVAHWGMVMAVYPFWGAVAMQVGRLLRIQGSVAAVQVQRRIREQYGERETVSRRARYVLRSYLDWGLLDETGTKGIYSAGKPLAVDDPGLIAWLIEASLAARSSGSGPLKDVVESPSLFPFHLKPMRTDTLISASENLDILRHGLDDDLVMLSKLS